MMMLRQQTHSQAMSLDRLADHGLQLAERFLLARGELPSLVVAYRSGEVCAAVPLAWSDAEQRARQLARIREIFVTMGIDAYYVAQEVKMIEQVADRSRPREFDTAKVYDGVRVIAADRDGSAVVRLCLIERDPAGYPTRVDSGRTLEPVGGADDLGHLASFRLHAH
jgi:hypothetical protein